MKGWYSAAQMRRHLSEPQRERRPKVSVPKQLMSTADVSPGKRQWWLAQRMRDVKKALSR